MGSWSLPGRELFECLLGTRCHPLVRDSLCGIVLGSHPRRPSGGAMGTFTQQRARINSSISHLSQAPPQGSRGLHHSLSSTFSWQAPEMHDVSKEQPFQGTAQSWCEWWDEVSLSGAPNLLCQVPLVCPLLRMSFTLLRVPTPQDSGLWSLSSNICTCFFLAGHLRFSEFRLFQKLLSSPK